MFHSQLPGAAVDLTSGRASPARLNLDDVVLSDAIAAVLAHPEVARQRPVTSRAPAGGRKGDTGAPRLRLMTDLSPTPPAALDGQALDSSLLLVDLGQGRNRLGGSVLAQTRGGAASTAEAPAAVDPSALKACAAALQALNAGQNILAGQARGAGGLLACVAGMARAGQVGAALNIDTLVIEGDGISDSRMDSGEVKNWTQQVSGLRHELTLRALFAEEAGVVLQLRTADRGEVMRILREHGLGQDSHFIGKTRPAGAAVDQGKYALSIWRDTQTLFSCRLADLGTQSAGTGVSAPE